MAGQIVLEYEHPHLSTYINDNTAVTTSATSASEGVKFINVFISKKGRDGVFLKFKDEESFIEEYGTPNFYQHGQPIYNAYAALKTRQAECYCMRVMPEDAAYGNIVFAVQYKVDRETNPEQPKLILRHIAKSYDSFVDKTDLESLVDRLANDEPDSAGFVTLPLMGFHSIGRGEYGNGFRVRLASVVTKNKNQVYKTYKLEVFETENGLERKEQFEASLYDGAVVENSSIFYEDVVNDETSGSSKINMYVNPYTIEELYDIYLAEINPENPVTIEQFDILYGTTSNKTAIEGIEIDTAFEEFIALDRVEGVSLNGGTDGAITLSTDRESVRKVGYALARNTRSVERSEAISALYVKAFKGEIDKSIISKRRTPARFILDAGYSSEVKRQIINLGLSRYDAFIQLDAGILNNVTEALDWGQTMAVEAEDRIISKNFQHFKIKDPFTGKKIPVTVTYMLAATLPKHIMTNGDHIPLVGEKYAKLTGIVKNSLCPFIDADELDIKEQLYDLRLNYFECLQENTFVRGTQQTSQEADTDLSEEHNMYVLLDMKRIVENRVSSNLYDFAEAEDRVRFKQDCEDDLATFKHKVREFTVEFSMSEYEESRGILHCYLSIVYKSIAKRGIIEIDINKRS